MRRNRRKRTTVKNYDKYNNIHAVNRSAPVVSHNLSKDITKDRSPEVKKNRYGDIIYSMMYVEDEKFEYWVDYDEKRRPIKYKDSRGYTWSCIYNSKGNIHKYWDNSGYSEEYRYYANNLIICTNSIGNKIKKYINRNRYITRDVFILSKDNNVVNSI